MLFVQCWADIKQDGQDRQGGGVCRCAPWLMLWTWTGRGPLWRPSMLTCAKRPASIR